MIHVIFINIFHYSLDDRTFYHQAQSLVESGCKVTIISTKEDLHTNINGIEIRSFDSADLSQREKINRLTELLKLYEPDRIICDAPMAIRAASQYKKQRKLEILYDVTEFYPGKKSLTNIHGIKRILKYIAFALFNFYGGLKTDKFIFGEYYKSRAFAMLFWKRKMFVPYFPDLKYIKVYPMKDISKEIRILYSGEFNEEKGIFNVLSVAHGLSQRHKELTIYLNLIGKFSSGNDKKRFDEITKTFPSNITIHIIGFLPFEEYCNTIGNSHIYLDLREKDYENTHCLPIKLFYYLACERPVIYSALEAIQRFTGTEYNCITLSEPDNINLIVSKISSYITDNNNYRTDCAEAGTLARKKYNWDSIRQDFVQYVTGN